MNVIEQIVSQINEKKIYEAKELIEKNEHKLAKNVDFLSAKAMYYINVGEYRDAVNILKTALKLESDNADLYCNLAYAYETLDNDVPIEKQKDTFNDIIIKKYSKRISHTKGTPMPSRTQSFESLLETDAPLVSIIVLAYNKVEFTKQCIDSIYKYTDDVDYELIVVDNGSSDGTLDYFKSLPKKRIVRLEENQGGGVGFNEGIKAARGKYVAAVGNDFIFTKNWLSNLVKCIESDESIGYVSPGSSYVSNNQQIDLKFSNVDEMQSEAAKYNISDPRKWEERIRLLPNVLFVRCEVFDIVGYNDPAFYYGEFADDDLSYRIRRAGYKLVYCGDTFTYHHGHVTGGVDQKENNSLEVSHKLFIEKHNGIDSWQDIKQDVNLINLIDLSKYSNDKKVRILGIDVRCGNSLLMAKNKLKQSGISNVELCAYVQEPKYYQDLKSICSNVQVGKIESIAEMFKYDLFDYIIFDESLNTYYNPYRLLDDGLSLLKQSGQAIMSLFNSQDAQNISVTLSNKYFENDAIKSNFTLFNLEQYINSAKFQKVNLLKEYHNFSENYSKTLFELAKKVSLGDDIDSFLDKLKIYRYAISIIK